VDTLSSNNRPRDASGRDAKIASIALPFLSFFI